jgi:hypothetical protein
LEVVSSPDEPHPKVKAAATNAISAARQAWVEPRERGLRTTMCPRGPVRFVVAKQIIPNMLEMIRGLGTILKHGAEIVLR